MVANEGRDRDLRTESTRCVGVEAVVVFWDALSLWVFIDRGAVQVGSIS